MRVIAILVVLVFEGYYWEKGHSTTVTYDHKALVIDGKRRILQSGSIHYSRSTPEVNFIFIISYCEMEFLIDKVESCLCVCTYIKWGRGKVKFNTMGMGELDNATELQGSW